MVAVLNANDLWVVFATSAELPAVPALATDQPPPTVAFNASCTEWVCKSAVFLPL